MVNKIKRRLNLSPNKAYWFNLFEIATIINIQLQSASNNCSYDWSLKYGSSRCFLYFKVNTWKGSHEVLCSSFTMVTAIGTLNTLVVITILTWEGSDKDNYEAYSATASPW